MEKVYSRTKTIQEDKVSGFCPGCMHGTVMKLIGEVLDEMKLTDYFFREGSGGGGGSSGSITSACFSIWETHIS